VRRPPHGYREQAEGVIGRVAAGEIEFLEEKDIGKDGDELHQTKSNGAADGARENREK